MSIASDGSLQLPSGWADTTLPSVCQILDSKRIPVNKRERSRRVEGKAEGDLYPYYGATGKVGVIDDFLFEGEHVLVGEDGAPFLDPFKVKAYLACGRFWVNNHAHILKSMISNRYVCHYLNQINYSDHVTGTTRLKLTQNALKKVSILVAPANEQLRIVAKIDELFSEIDKGIESLKTALRHLVIYRKSVLHHAFEGKLTAQWRLENKDKIEKPEQLLGRIEQERKVCYEQHLKKWKIAVEAWEHCGKKGNRPTKPKPANTPSPVDQKCQARRFDLPDGWVCVPLGHLFSVSPQNGVYKPASEYGSGTRIIRIDDFYNGKLIRQTKFKRLHLNNDEIDKYDLRNSDLIVNRVNSIEYLGKCALVSNLSESTVVESNVMRCRLIDNVISKVYVSTYLTSDEGIKRLRENAKHAVNQASINQTDVSNTLVPIPSIEEQRLIVQTVERQLSQVDSLVSQVESHIDEAEVLRQSILSRAFSGQLVPQDPNDEPASVLLDRIKAERKQSAESGMDRKRDMEKRATA